MKTFGELNIGDELYCLNAMDAPWGSVTKYKILDITKNPIHWVFKYYDTYYNEETEFRVRPNTSIGMLAPTLEGVKEYWKNDYEYQIKQQEKEIENLKAGLVSMYDSLDKILKAKE